MQKKIAVIGSLTMDLFLRPQKSWVFSHVTEDEKKEFFALPHGGKMPVDHLEEHFGGGSSNVAVSFSLQNVEAFAFGAIGNDSNGKKIVEHLQKKSVWTQNIEMIEDENSGFSAIISAFDGERTVLFTSGANKKFSRFDIVESVDALYLCHIATEFADFILDQVSKFFEKNPEKILAWNPGKEAIDLGLEGNRHVLRHVDILFLNREEAELFAQENAIAETSFGEERRRQYGLSGKTFSPLPSYVSRVDHIAKKFLDTGVKIVVITDGRRGAQVFSSEDSFFIGAVDGPRVDTLGAGDAFASTFTAQFLHGKSLRDCAKYASMQAASVVGHFGAQPGLLPSEEIQNRCMKFEPSFALFSLYQ